MLNLFARADSAVVFELKALVCAVFKALALVCAADVATSKAVKRVLLLVNDAMGTYGSAI